MTTEDDRKTPKKVAIIGAGPSGLVTAKTLLHHFPTGQFQAIIFEKKTRIGGLWAVDYPTTTSPEPAARSDSGSIPLNSSHGQSTETSHGNSKKKGAFVDPWMRTNLSRFSVAFSDLSWDTALGTTGVPEFPCAWEVRKYLEKYTEIYIPDECIKLGKTVLRTERRISGGWTVWWTDGDLEESIRPDKNGEKIHKEEFDFLVVASGHFGTPHIPPVPGIEIFPGTIHSSELQSPADVDRLIQNAPEDGKLVVVGGSMSGVEAAASLSLHLSSMNLNPNTSGRTGNAYEVWHITTGPFWVLPRYLPHRSMTDKPEANMPFVPLDLSLYDLSRRPPGKRGITFGPVTPEQIQKKNRFFENMLGKEYSNFGAVNLFDSQRNESQRPPWVGISDQYAEYVRYGAIKTVGGRAVSVSPSDSRCATINIEISDTLQSLSQVSAIVMATGFKSNNSLSFLPEDVLNTLKYSAEDDFIPLILDSWNTAHSKIPDLGFVGFYRGAFWGPAELQAQNLAQRWTNADPDDETSVNMSADEEKERAAERQRVREYREVRPSYLRGQFPLGDYVGLVETLAEQSSRDRVPLETKADGPVIPARYPGAHLANLGLDHGQKEVEITMRGLKRALLPGSEYSSAATTAAIFRALHGQWQSQKVTTSLDGEETSLSGQATFHPRYPSGHGYQAEYLCEEIQGMSITRSVYRMREMPRFPGQAGISVWSVNDTSPNTAAELLLELLVEPTGETADAGNILVKAACSKTSDQERHTYQFYFDRVAITSWCHSICTPGGAKSSTRYTRTTP